MWELHIPRKVLEYIALRESPTTPVGIHEHCAHLPDAQSSLFAL